jgi:hypothetical protein
MKEEKLLVLLFFSFQTIELTGNYIQKSLLYLNHAIKKYVHHWNDNSADY